MPLNSDMFIGFDGGGTKTTCVIGDASGRIIGSAVGDSTNLKSRPEKVVREVIHDLMAEVLKLGNASVDQLTGVFVSTAGGDREEDRKRWTQWILDFGVNPKQINVENDAVGALASGTKAKNGIVLIAGTGSIAYSVRSDIGKTTRVGGWGYLLGDEGSGYSIGNHALKMILRSFDGRDEKKEAITEHILNHLGLERPEQLITFIYEDPYPRKVIASIAKHVIFLAEQNEQHATVIIQHAMDQLIELVSSIVRQDEVHATLPLVISGGLFQSAYFRKVFEQSMRMKGYTLPIIVPKYPPVVGAYMCALLQNDLIITDEIEQNITNSWDRALTLCNTDGGI
ncbi:hypothetical protein FZW96_07530 [Bacillus sp. BGMRC 2118]|nr:hypothetical protein FZW96_07530 [Bacillus sp. BGMRC 2118]